MLSEFLWLNNNNAVGFEVTVEPHGLRLGADADAAFRTWNGGAVDDFQFLKGASLAAALAETEQAAADMALWVRMTVR